MIHLEYDGDEEWINSLEEGWRTQSMDQWVEWLTRPASEDELPKIGWIIEGFTGNKKDDGKPGTIIKSWAHPVGVIKDLQKIYIQTKRGVSVLSLPLAKCTERIF